MLFRSYGPLDAVKYDIQYGAIAAAAVQEKAKSAVEDKLRGLLGGKKDQPAQSPAGGALAAGQAQKPQSAEDKAKEKLRGLFGR